MKRLSPERMNPATQSRPAPVPSPTTAPPRGTGEPGGSLRDYFYELARRRLLAP